MIKKYSSRWVIGTGLVMVAAAALIYPPMLARLLNRNQGFFPDTVDFLRLVSGLLTATGILLIVLQKRVTSLFNVGLAILCLALALAAIDLYLRRFDPKIPVGPHFMEPDPATSRLDGKTLDLYPPRESRFRGDNREERRVEIHGS